MFKKLKNIRPGAAALVGVLCAFPFVFLNFIVGNRIEPLYSLIRPGIHTSALEYILLHVIILLIPVGASMALVPALQKGANGKRKLYPLNIIIAVALFTFFIFLAIGLGSDIYRCDILKVPNCD